MIQGPVFDSAFWLNFWPQLAATIVGVLIGVPVGLALNRLATGALAAAQKTADAARLSGALASLEASIKDNRHALDAIVALQDGHYLLEPQLETTTWGAVKSEVVTLLRVPELQRALAKYFDTIEREFRLCNRLAAFSSGVDAAMGGAEDVRQGTRTRMKAVAADAIVQSDAILAAITEAKKL